MHMRHVMWLLWAAMIAVGLLAVGASAQTEATPDQSTVSQSQTTVERSTTTTTTGPAAVAPGTTAAPGVAPAAACPPGMVAYVPSAEVTLTGAVTSAPMLAAPTDTDYQMMIQTSDGVQHRVWLAPAGFLQRRRFSPAVNDQVTVIGMPLGASGDIVARQITWGGHTYLLRSAQGGPMWGRMGRRAMRGERYGYGAGRFRSYSSLFNPSEVQTVSGRIDDISEFYPDHGAGPGTQIRLRVSGFEPEDIPSWQLPSGGLVAPYVWVHLGPSWYVQQRFPDLHRGEQVTVTGSPVIWRGEPILIASSMQVGSRAIAFRGPNGYPMWAGGWQRWSTAVSAMPGSYANFQTISGTIRSVQSAPVTTSMGQATVVTILTPDNSLVNVAFAPTTFPQQLNFAVGQPITVVAAPSLINGQDLLIANQLSYNNQSYAMSSLNGVCSWSTTAVAALPTGFQTFTGAIQSVQNLPAMGGFGPSLLVAISTANNCTANVVIAPDTFARQVGVTLQPGQQITVVAAPATLNGQAALIANQVSYSGQTFVMSNINGAYSWSTATGVAALPGTVGPGY